MPDGVLLSFPSRNSNFLSSLSLKKHAVKLAVSYAIKLSGHKYPVDAHLIVLRKFEVSRARRGGLFLYDQHRGLEWRFVILLAHKSDCAARV